MNAVDTNALLYVHDPRDAAKKAIADSVVKTLQDGVLLWQVACKYISASRKLEPYGFSRAEAWQELRALQQIWATRLPSWNVMQKAEVLLNRYSLSFWDAMIAAACLEAGVSHLYSEDFGGYFQIEGLLLINPFKTP